MIRPDISAGRAKVSHTALIRSLTRQKIPISNDVKEII